MKIIRILFRIILLPVQIILTLLELFLTMLLEIGTGVLYLVMLLTLVASISSFIQGDTRTGIQALVLTYLFSPYGLPLIGVLVIVPIALVKEAIKSIFKDFFIVQNVAIYLAVKGLLRREKKSLIRYIDTLDVVTVRMME